MKKLKNSIACALVCVCALAAIPLSGCSTPSKGQTEIIITPAAPFSGYSQRVRGEAVDRLVSTCSNVLTELVGTPPTHLNLLRVTADRVVSAFEDRAVAEEELLSAVEILCANEEALVGLFSDRTASYSAAVKLFSDLSSLYGADLAARLMGDFAVVYCRYRIDSFTEMYYQTPLPFLQTNIRLWEEKKQGFERLGEENLSRLLRLSVSGSGLLTEEIALPVGAGEAALFLRAQGELMQGLTLDGNDWNFVLSLLGEWEEVPRLAALYQSGAFAALSAHAPTLVLNLSRALASCTAEWTKPLFEGKIGQFFYFLTREWTDGEWTAFERAVTAHGDYLGYLTERGYSEAYGAFLSAYSGCSLQTLRLADAQAFQDALVGYIFGVSPSLAFMVFEL